MVKFNWLLWVIVAIILWRTVVPLGTVVRDFPLNDFSVYIGGTKVALNGENPYQFKFFDRYNYSPAATVFFIPLARLPIELSEWLFTGMSVVSVWLAVGWTLKILGFSSFRADPERAERVEGEVKESRSPAAADSARFRSLGMTRETARNNKLVSRWLIFALSLKMFPVKLTLALGQINLIILALLIGSFYFSEIRLPRPPKRPRNDDKRGVGEGETFEALSGILFGLATVIKLTPAPIVLYFFLKKKWSAVTWTGITIAIFTAIGVFIFGWDLTAYYFGSVVPGLMSEVTKETVNASYMNQSVTALLARMGIFGDVATLVRLAISGGMVFIVIGSLLAMRPRDSRFDFSAFWSLAMISTLVFPVFVWQHHYVFLLPAWIILLHVAVRSRRLFGWVAAGGGYILLNFYFRDANLLAGKNPLIVSHFLLTGIAMLILITARQSSSRNFN